MRGGLKKTGLQLSVGLLAAAVVLTGCTAAAPSASTSAAPLTRTAPLPSGFADTPLVAWIDGAFVVIGGERSEKQKLSAGFRLDATTGTWTPLADAPVGLDAFDQHVVLGGVLYVVSVTLASHGPSACSAEKFYSYTVATNTWAELPLPAGECSLDSDGLVATSDAILAVKTGTQTAFKQATDAVFDPQAKTWRQVTAPGAATDVRWASVTSAGVLVAVEKAAPKGAFTMSSPALPEVYSWDYRTGASTRVDRAGSGTLDWKQWTGRIQSDAGPVYFQDHRLLSFDAASGTFTLRTPDCGGAACDQLSAGAFSLGTGASNAAVSVDGWAWGRQDGATGNLVRPSTGETKAVSVPTGADPSRAVVNSTMVGGVGAIISCPLTPSTLPHGGYVDDATSTPAPLTHDGNAGTGQPGTLIRVYVASPGLQARPTVLAVDGSGKWTYRPGSETEPFATVQTVAYVHKDEMQPYCYLIRY